MIVLKPLVPYLAKLVCPPTPSIPLGRPKLGSEPQTSTESSRRCRQKQQEEKRRCIAVLDMETDPFDAVERAEIRPFVACLYSDEFDPIIIWEEDHERFVDGVLRAIAVLPDRYTIYAHNGGKFDYMFLVSGLRGEVKFKGRGIMCAMVGGHELRDSFHIIPEKLAAIQKETFDYNKMKKGLRNHYRKEIIDYLLSDCKYLLEIVKDFVSKFGFKLSIGQAAIYELRKHYTVKKFTKSWDAYIRNYFFGGRVECLQGRGHWKGNYKLYDVNSMYPYVMANYQHPTGGFFDYIIRYGEPGKDTVFIDLECENNNALMRHAQDGESIGSITRGRFRTTIWEYEVAKKYNLIQDVRIKYCIDCAVRSDFSKFVLPLYENRLRTKKALADLERAGLKNTEAYIAMKRDDIFYKLLLNNAYGKFAQNPRNFKEHYLTDPDELPPDDWFMSLCIETGLIKKDDGRIIPPEGGWYDYACRTLKDDELSHTLPHFESERYWIWKKPAPSFRYNNVGTAASITGAARAVLLDAMQNARDLLYCDTDSLICRDLGNVHIDKTALGAWDLESEFSEVIICGKKTYACKLAGLPDGHLDQIKIRSKGTSGLDWDMMQRMLAGNVMEIFNRAPTLNRYGEQNYIKRRISATAPLIERIA